MQFQRQLRRFLQGPVLILISCFIATTCMGQSLDIGAPTPVRTNEIAGSIAARDLGDSRLTDHFYAFVGTPGDVLITVRGNNLNGDVDVFAAAGMRPLLKFTLYAESSSPVTKSTYLRKREDLVIRVEARTPNDDEGTYVIRLGGSFQPIVGEDLVAANDSQPAPEAGPRRGTRRVNSVGARLPEPPPPTIEVTTSAVTPEPSPVEVPTAKAPDNAEIPEAPRPEASRPAPRTARSTRPTGRRRQPSATIRTETPAAAETEAAPKIEQPSETEPKVTTTGRRSGRRGTAPASEPPAQPESQTGPRLIIELQDGTRFERYMNAVRRVTVDNIWIVVVSKLGRIERIQMSEIVRMSIEP